MSKVSLLGLLMLLATSSAGAAEPVVVDPWLEPARLPPTPTLAFAPLSEIVDPWEGLAERELLGPDDIVDPWASYHPVIPTAIFPLIE